MKTNLQSFEPHSAQSLPNLWVDAAGQLPNRRHKLLTMLGFTLPQQGLREPNGIGLNLMGDHRINNAFS
jgi:hypothetical protein